MCAYHVWTEKKGKYTGKIMAKNGGGLKITPPPIRPGVVPKKKCVPDFSGVDESGVDESGRGWQDLSTLLQ